MDTARNSQWALVGRLLIEERYIDCNIIETELNERKRMEERGWSNLTESRTD